MLSILQSIDSIVQYNVYGISKYQLGLYTSTSSTPRSEICIRDENFPSLLLDRLFAVFPMQSTCALPEEDDHYDGRYYILNGVMSQIFFTFNQHICPLPVLRDRFLSLLKCWLSEVHRNNVSSRAFSDKHLPSLVSFIPYLVSTVDDQEHQLLKAFTTAFVNCSPDSSLKMACLGAVEEMLALQYVVSVQEAVLHLLLRLGQIGLSNSDLAEEYDKLQDVLQKFYCISTENGAIWLVKGKEQGFKKGEEGKLGFHGGWFRVVGLSWGWLREVRVALWGWFLGVAVVWDGVWWFCGGVGWLWRAGSLESSVVFRIIEVLQSSYKAGHIHIEDYISFLLTLLSQYKNTPG
ncbi:hypothetical protein RDABS01_026105 [Bienertia sinuspersici]